MRTHLCNSIILVRTYMDVRFIPLAASGDKARGDPNREPLPNVRSIEENSPPVYFGLFLLPV